MGCCKEWAHFVMVRLEEQQDQDKEVRVGWTRQDLRLLCHLSAGGMGPGQNERSWSLAFPVYQPWYPMPGRAHFSGTCDVRDPRATLPSVLTG